MTSPSIPVRTISNRTVQQQLPSQEEFSNINNLKTSRTKRQRSLEEELKQVKKRESLLRASYSTINHFTDPVQGFNSQSELSGVGMERALVQRQLIWEDNIPLQTEEERAHRMAMSEQCTELFLAASQVKIECDR